MVSTILNLEEERGDVQVKVAWGCLLTIEDVRALNRIEGGRIRGAMQREQDEEYEEDA